MWQLDLLNQESMIKWMLRVWISVIIVSYRPVIILVSVSLLQQNLVSYIQHLYQAPVSVQNQSFNQSEFIPSISLMM